MPERSGIGRIAGEFAQIADRARKGESKASNAMNGNGKSRRAKTKSKKASAKRRSNGSGAQPAEAAA
jgi:hypothetical protein